MVEEGWWGWVKLPEIGESGGGGGASVVIPVFGDIIVGHQHPITYHNIKFFGELGSGVS